jgi:hypothetical protein
MDQSKIAHLNPQEYTHLPHADQDFEGHEQTDVAIRPLIWTLIAIAVVIVVTAVGMWGLFQALKYLSGNAPENQALTDVEKIGFRHVPEGMPDLQGVSAQDGNPNSPAQDTDAMRKHNVDMLAGKAPMRPGMPNGMDIEAAMNEALAKKIFKTAGAPAAKPEAK